MKRDESVLKKAIEEANSLKRQVKKQATAAFDASSVRAARELKKQGKAGVDTMNVPDAEEIKNQFMDNLTSKLENYFFADDYDKPAEGEGASSIKRQSSSIVDADNDQENTLEGDKIAEKSMQEATKASSIEDKEKLLSAVQQNVDQIKSDLGELLKNTWASRIQEIQSQMNKMEQDKKKNIASASAAADNKQIQAIEKDYKKKMDELMQQIKDQEKQKKKKEDTITKTMMQQESRIKVLEQEIEKIKKERAELERQKKYGEERFSKLKSTVTKETTAFKKTVQEKDKTASKLKRDLQKTDALVAQKISELKGLQKKAKEDKERRLKEEDKENEKKGIDIEGIKDWITESTDQLLKQQELAEYLKQ